MQIFSSFTPLHIHACIHAHLLSADIKLLTEVDVAQISSIDKEMCTKEITKSTLAWPKG